MKFFNLIFTFFTVFYSFSQNPIIVGDSIICSDGFGTLTTTTAFDSYQWYRRYFGAPQNQSTPILGETSQTLQMDYFNYAASYLKVQVVTSSNDTLISDEFFVDGYMFNSPTLAVSGEFQVINDGDYFVCEGDSLLLELMDPYNVNISWYKDGVLMNENTEQIYVDQPGYYEVYGAPELCPNYIQTPGFGAEFVTNENCDLAIDDISDYKLNFLNPVNSEIIIYDKTELSNYEIFDLNSKLIKSGKIINNRIAVNDLNPGVYFIRFDEFIPQRFVKE